MLRVGMAALVMLVSSSTATAVAADRASTFAVDGAMSSARQQSTASIAKARPRLGALPAARLRVAGVPVVRSAFGRPAPAEGEPRATASVSVRALAQIPALDLPSHLALRSEDDDESSLAYAFNDSVSLGLGYRLVTDESLGLEVAEAGAIDSGYTNHGILLRAHWQF